MDHPPTPSPPPHLPPQTDGWLEGSWAPTPGQPLLPDLRPSHGGLPTPADRAARARANALLCHMSVLFGLPIFLMFLWRQRDPFLLHHAKSAGAIYTLFYTSIALAIAFSSVFLLLSALLYASSLVAIWRASGGGRAGWGGLGPVGEGLFFPFQRPRPKRLTTDPQRALPQEEA